METSAQESRLASRNVQKFGRGPRLSPIARTATAVN